MVASEKHRFCPSLLEWRKEEDRVLQTNLGRFVDTLTLVTEANEQYRTIILSLPTLERNSPQVIICLMLYKAQKSLLIGLGILLRGAIPEYQAVVRNALMFAADAVKIAERPELGDIWTNRDKKPGEYDRAFKPAFPPGHTITGRLYDSYKIFSEAGTHSNLSQLSLSIIESPDEHVFLYIHTKRNETLLHLLYLLSLLPAVLLAFTYGLKKLLPNDTDEKIMTLVARIEEHKEEYREDVMPPHLRGKRG